MADNSIRLHVGVHKTATTYIQKMLTLNRAQSAAMNLSYWPISIVRPLFHLAVEEKRRSKTHKFASAMFGETDRQRHLGERMAQWFSLSGPITISEENILGESSDCQSGTIYPEAEMRLGMLAERLPDRPVEVWLCIRSYPDFLASIYGESLRHGNFLPLGTFMERNLAPQGQWPRLVDVIRRTMPRAKLIMWPYEKFRKHEPLILSQLSGLDYSSLQPLDQSIVLPSASGKAIEEMVACAAPLTAQQRIFKMLELQYKFPLTDGTPRFSPWHDEIRASMEEAYKVDLAAIAARDNVTLLD